MSDLHRRYGDPGTGAATDQLRAFLTERLSEDLARIWGRQDLPAGRPRPGAAAQVEVVDDLLRTLGAGRLPVRRDLRMLLYGYSGHPRYDARWAELMTA